MTKFGKRLIKAAREAQAIAQDRRELIQRNLIVGQLPNDVAKGLRNAKMKPAALWMWDYKYAPTDAPWFTMSGKPNRKLSFAFSGAGLFKDTPSFWWIL